MKKTARTIFIVIFCAVLGLSFAVFNIFSKQLSMDSHENRLMTGLPQVLQSPLRELSKNLDNFFVDNSPFRYQFVLLNAGLDYKLFGTSQSDQVLPGKDGWLFYKDGPTAAQPMANYQGLTVIDDSDETLAHASAALQILSDDLAENGCTLVLDLTPSKDRIYREYMPEFDYRLKVKGGLTGFAQIYGKYNTTPYDKLKLDLMYIENYSLRLDLKLILVTLKVIFMKESTEGVAEGQITATQEPAGSARESRGAVQTSGGAARKPEICHEKNTRTASK